VEPTSPTYETEKYGDVSVIDATATRDPDTGETAIFVINRHQEQSTAIEVNVAALGKVSVQEALTIADDDLGAANTQQDPDRVVPRAIAASVDGGVLRIELPPASWTCVRVTAAS
jgi:alpha-L-arabinofuranosidase